MIFLTQTPAVLFWYIRYLSYIIASFGRILHHLSFHRISHAQFFNGNPFNFFQVNVAFYSAVFFVIG